MVVILRRRRSSTNNRVRLPTLYSIREFVAAGGLMSYGTNFPCARINPEKEDETAI
jgi:hypothetical protein